MRASAQGQPPIWKLLAEVTGTLANRSHKDAETRAALPLRDLSHLSALVVFAFCFSQRLRVSAVNMVLGELALPRLQQSPECLPHSKQERLELHAAAEIVVGTEGGGKLVGFAGGEQQLRERGEAFRA